MSPISRRRLRIAALAAPLLLIGGCASIPSGPSLSALPGTGRSFDQFRVDDSGCRAYATSAIGGSSPAEAQAGSAVASAAVGTAVGAIAGGALGGSEGAAAGAGIGLLFGSVIGADAANASGYSLQQRYDSAYVQCMYAKGHKVPVSGVVRSSAPRTAARPATPPPGVRYPPPGYAFPPPPPGYAPPPPPR
jgi:hypothetical protein